MALHIREQIMQAVVAAARTTETAGARVWRARQLPLSSETTPYIVVSQGDDNEAEGQESTQQYQGRALDVLFEILTQAPDGETEGGYEIESNKITVEIEEAVNRDLKAAVAAVHDITAAGLASMDYDADAERPVSGMLFIMRIQYFRDWDNPTTFMGVEI